MYKVIKMFKDTKDNGHVYVEGDVFPHEESVVEKFKDHRIAELQSDKNKIGEPLIELVEEGIEGGSDDQESEDKTESEFPKYVGGGNYELSNGDKVKGKAEAQVAEAALKE